MYGKIIDGRLVIAGNIITTDKGVITNPTEEQLILKGYLPITYTEKPQYNKEEEKLVERYEIQDDTISVSGQDEIIVNYEVVKLTDIEKLKVKKQQVILLEQQYNMCRYQRELILAENSGASQYVKDKAQEIENIAKDLR